MIISKKLLPMLRPLLSEMSVPDDTYGHIMRTYSPACKCSAKIKTLNYYELCELAKNNHYLVSIIQNGKIFNTNFNHCFYGAYEHINPCYQISPFTQAIVIARNICKYNSFIIFRYEPSAFDKIIFIPRISYFKYLFEYFDIYKSKGILAKNLNELRGAREIIAISKETLGYTRTAEDYGIHIILRWYK